MPAILVTSPWGGPQSNCYLTEVEATSYIETAKIFYDEWLELPDKHLAALITATQDIDALNWAGERWYWNQLLEFPRFDPEGGLVVSAGSRATPSVEDALLSAADEYLRQQRLRVQTACAEQALYRLRNRGLNAYREDQGHGIRSAARGGRGSFGYGDPDQVLCPEAMDQLRAYVGSMRVVRR